MSDSQKRQVADELAQLSEHAARRLALHHANYGLGLREMEMIYWAENHLHQFLPLVTPALLEQVRQEIADADAYFQFLEEHPEEAARMESGFNQLLQGED